MEKLNRQILGSENWGSSVNANWGKIEAGIGGLQQQLDEIKDQIEVDYGVMFGGFLRFDKLPTEQAPDYVCITQSIEEDPLNTSYHIDLNLVPINRIYRVVGNWPGITDAEPPYNVAWVDGNMCVYAASGYRSVFWNNYVFEPDKIDGDGLLHWVYTDTPHIDGTTTMFPSNMVDAISYKYKINDFTLEDTKLTCLVPYIIDATGFTGEDADKYFVTDVKFYTSNHAIMFAAWEFNNTNNNQTKLVLDKDDFPEYDPAKEDSDYVVLTYYKLDINAMPTIRMGPVYMRNWKEPLSTENPITFTVEIMDGQVRPGDELQLCQMALYNKPNSVRKLRSFVNYTVQATDIGKRYIAIQVNDNNGLKRLLSTGTKTVDQKTQHSNYNTKYLRIRRPLNITSKALRGGNALFSNVVPFTIYGRYDVEAKKEGIYKSYETVSIW